MMQRRSDTGLSPNMRKAISELVMAQFMNAYIYVTWPRLVDSLEPNDATCRHTSGCQAIT